MSAASRSTKDKSKLTKEEWREYTKTVWHIANTRHGEHPAVFPEEIPRRLIKLFSFVGETVLDPFCGAGTTAEVALTLDRRAVCVDQSARYVKITTEACRRRLKELKKPEGYMPVVVCGDCRRLDSLGDDSVGLIVTSPPYWNKAAYGRKNANLGKIGNYKDFLDQMRPALTEFRRVLQPGRKICVVTANVNQHTNHGLLTFPLATDFAVMLRDVGFVMVSEVIWSKDKTGGKWGSWGRQRPIFGSYPYPPNFLFKNVHEYVLIFAKPGRGRVRGPKVVSYEKMMKGSGNGNGRKAARR